jgi:hypothetical protein
LDYFPPIMENPFFYEENEKKEEFLISKREYEKV